ncbi:MAG TPA: acetylxylan esterase [Candidatus Eisenbacteria bacterium]|jgi:dienelactone hydrolase|nr:acetylxylan esterase [Candidatus Eisenbacteria bacterium]
MKRALSFDLANTLLALLLLSVLAANLLAADTWPEVSQLPLRLGPPDPLVMFNGQPVTSKKQWVNQRRPELKKLFAHYMYGTAPPAPAKIEFAVERVDKNFIGGKATKKEVTISFGSDIAPRIHLLLVTPNQRKRPAPVFVGVNFCGNHALVDDPTVRLTTAWMYDRQIGATNNRATDAGRGKQIDVWAIEQSIDRGYAAATFYSGDLEPDKADAPEGIRRSYANAGKNFDWGAIAAWAWGLSRAVDYLATDKDIDAKRIAVVGHSRYGKTALLAAAFDERMALAIPLQAGCGGTAPSRGKVGESVKQINNGFPHWFNAEFKKFNEQVDRLPFDQHCLVALCAPRPVLFSNAVEDSWANPTGQFEVLQAANPVYRLLKAGGLDAARMPETGKLIDSQLGYYIRPGKHSMTKDDWKIFLDFADRHFGKPKR